MKIIYDSIGNTIYKVADSAIKKREMSENCIAEFVNSGLKKEAL